MREVPGAIAADYPMAMQAACHVVKGPDLIRIRNTCFCFFILVQTRWPLASVYEIDITVYILLLFILSGRSLSFKERFDRLKS